MDLTKRKDRDKDPQDPNHDDVVLCDSRRNQEFITWWRNHGIETRRAFLKSDEYLWGCGQNKAMVLPQDNDGSFLGMSESVL